MINKITFSFLLVMVFTQLVFGQGQTVSGTVTEAETGMPLPGVTVMEKATSNGTSTDFDGKFSLQVGEDAILVFSMVGYKTQEIPADAENFNIELETDTEALEEVVVVGYGQQKKVNVTGSVSALEGEEFASQPVGQVSTALQGMASGVTVQQNSGQPGADGGSINIRGVGSLSGTDEYGNTINKNSPLVLIDGIEGNINNIDANDIESISVLKDAAASSIYGVRAANGVILVTTKRGAEGKTNVSYSGYIGWQDPTQLPEFLGAQDYMRLVNLMSLNSGESAKFTQNDIAAYDDPNRNVNNYPNTYWMDEVLQGSGFQQKHSVAISSGNQKSSYRLSANYFNQEGLVGKTDFERLTLRLNTDVDLSEKLHLTADLSTNFSDRTEPQGVGGGMWFQFGQAYLANPTLPVRYTDGTWGMARDGNPVRLQHEGGKYEYEDNVLRGNFRLDYNVLEGLTVSALTNVNYTTTFNYLNNSALTYTDFFTGDETVKDINDITNNVYKTWHTNYQGLINYQKTFGTHDFNILGGIQRIEDKTSYFSAYRSGGSLDELDEIDAGEASTMENDGYTYEYALLSYFARLNYSFKDRYLLEANIRRDGSSRFSEDNRWGVFPSFSVGWRISQESFMQNVDFLKELKVRGSWGQLGNQEIGRYPYQSLMVLGYNYPFGGSVSTGTRMETAVNRNISWETTEMTDFGLDASFLNGKIDLTFDYYIKNTKDILLDLRIPSTVGLNAPYQNAGEVKNRGWELSLGYKGKINDFEYSVRGNLSDVKNEITSLNGTYLISANGGNTNVTINQEGEPISAFYGYRSTGIFQSEEEIANHATQSAGTTSPGDLIYEDINGDGVVNADDRTIIGSNIPRYTYGLNLNGNYKNFDLSVFFQGVGKVDVNTLQPNMAPTNQDGNFKDIHLDSWTPDNTDASYPRLTTSSVNNVVSSYWIRSGSYLRLKNVELGYKLPETLTEKIGVSSFRIFVNGQNLVTWSGLNEYGIDPENPQDARYYPQVKTYTVGLNFNF